MVHRLSSVILFKAEPNALYNKSSNHELVSEAAHNSLQTKIYFVSSHCFPTKLCILLTSTLGTIKNLS